jgi:wyosine [tRNA(Phe)-imidazoG37] synthetase (radical SAM superfamily)
MSQGSFKYVYGPVASRRLGRSLGVDLVPFKTCSYDCIYCQLGRTTNKTIDLDEYVPMDDVLAELGDKLKEDPRPDFIGLAGSGEPTLHVNLGDIIDGVKTLTDVPVAVLTNGSLLWRPEVRASLAQANLVMPSLDAGTPSSFARVNRPHADISFEQMVDGLLTFSHEFKGEVWLEVLLLARITNRRDEVEKIATIADKMRIDRVQLNTVSRPPAEESALTVSADGLEKLQSLFSCPCEVIAETRQSQPVSSSRMEDIEDQILALLSRRPCTVEGIAAGLGIRPNEVLKHLDVLYAKGAIRSERKGEAIFYEGARNPS